MPAETRPERRRGGDWRYIGTVEIADGKVRRMFGLTRSQLRQVRKMVADGLHARRTPLEQPTEASERRRG